MVSYRQNDAPDTTRTLPKRPRLYVYPNTDGPLGVFDLEDLDHSSLCLLFKLIDDVLQVFIWRGTEWDGLDDVTFHFC